MKTAILDSFYNESNDHERIQAVKLSRQYVVWYFVTYDGQKWETRAHKPESFIQCVTFMNGKRFAVDTQEVPKMAIIDLLNRMSEVEANHYLLDNGITKQLIDLTIDQYTAKNGFVFFCDHSRNQGYTFYI